jgi:hypothetical protein
VRMVTGSPAMARKMPCEVLALHGQDLGQGFTRPKDIVGQDHLAHRVDAVALEEHVLGAAQADALGPEGPGHSGVVRGVGVGAHPRVRNSSTHFMNVPKSPLSLGSTVGTWPRIDLARWLPSKLIQSPFLMRVLPTLNGPL